MSIKKFLCFGLLINLYQSLGFAQSVWTDGAANQIWSDENNWSGGVPTASSNVFISTQPTFDQNGLDLNVSVANITFNSTLTGDADITTFTSETFTLNGNLTNNSSHLVSFSSVFIAGSSGCYTAGTGVAFYNFVDFDTSVVTLSGPIEFFTNLVFEFHHHLPTGASLAARLLHSPALQ